MLSVVMLSVVMLSVFMLNVTYKTFELNVVMLSVVAPMEQQGVFLIVIDYRGHH
jgi:hypothetical protein